MFRRARFLTYRQLDLAFRGIGNEDEYGGHGEERQLEESNSRYYEEGGANGLAAQMMRALSEMKGLEVTLVGHSMGAIVANDLVSEFPDMRFKRIIHMASADSNRNMLLKIFPYLKRNRKTEFWNLCLHPLNEEREQPALGSVPDGSLLIWLDYFLIDPETLLDRRAGRWDNVKWILPQFAETPNARVTMFGRCQLDKTQKATYKFDDKHSPDTRWPLKHGDFSNRLFWRKEFYSLR